VAERDFSCTTVPFPHARGDPFYRPLNDPDDDTHIITFQARRVSGSRTIYTSLSIDRMLLKSKDSPSRRVADAGQSSCRRERAANRKFATQQVSSVSCNAADGKRPKYEFQFESDGSPIKVDDQGRRYVVESSVPRHSPPHRAAQMPAAGRRSGVFAQRPHRLHPQCMEED